MNFEALTPGTTWPFRLKDSKGNTDVRIRQRLSVSTAETAVRAASEGVGATRVLHYQCADALRDGLLRIVLAEFEPGLLPVHMLHAQRGALPSKTKFFFDFAAQRLRERLKAL